MNNTTRILSVAWIIAGLALAVLGAQGLVDEPAIKIGRLWILPLGPLALLASAWGSLALGRGLWLGRSSVALWGRVMSVPLLALSVMLFVAGAVTFATGTVSLEGGLSLAGGLAGLGATVLNYRIAQSSGHR